MTVIDRGQPVKIFAEIEDVEKFHQLSIVNNDEDPDYRDFVDARHNQDILSDEAVDQVVVHVQMLAEKRELPCHCSGRTEDGFCACRNLRPDFLHPRKGPLNEL